MIVTAQRSAYIWQGSFDERSVPERAGFEWAPPGQWLTYRHSVADNLRASFDDKATALAATQTLTEWPEPIPVPAGKALMDFQKIGVAALLRRKNVLLADEMGLGKTIQVAALLNACPDILTALIVCPASLKWNWRSELLAWLTIPVTIAVVGVGVKRLPKANILIVNYDILRRHEWPRVDLLVLDEAHYCKNPTAMRTKAALSLKADRKVFLTGTPILARPAEAYTLLKALAPLDWPHRIDYGMRYCGGFCDQWGYNFDGASNLEELHDRLRSTVMVRRLKKDVLKELPPKRRQVVEMPAEGGVLKRERELLDAISYDQRVGNLKAAHAMAFENMAKVRHETALAKIPQVVDFVTDALESSDKIVLFAHHRDVIEALSARLAKFSPIVITGDTPPAKRFGLVNDFQTDATRRVFVGNMVAAGTGITLTASSHVIFAELDWTPGIVSQCEDRCHRKGQLDGVLVQHLVLEQSIDAIMAKRLVKKQDVLDRSLDGKADEPLNWEELFSG